MEVIRKYVLYTNFYNPKYKFIISNIILILRLKIKPKR